MDPVAVPGSALGPESARASRAAPTPRVPFAAGGGGGAPVLGARSGAPLRRDEPGPLRANAGRDPFVLDILAVQDDGTRTDVEIQAYPQPALANRALYHWARVFRDGIGRGNDFAALRPCRVIFVLAHRQLPGTRVHSAFWALEVHDGTLLSDALELHTVELPKLGDDAPTEPADAAVLDGARFLAAETDEERRRMATHNPDIDQANEALERLSQDPTARFLAQCREDQLRLLQVERAEVRRLRREEALRTAIEALAEVLGIELSPLRRAALAAMGGAELSALLEHLRRERGWPAGG